LNLLQKSIRQKKQFQQFPRTSPLEGGQ